MIYLLLCTRFSYSPGYRVSRWVGPGTSSYPSSFLSDEILNVLKCSVTGLFSFHELYLIVRMFICIPLTGLYIRLILPIFFLCFKIKFMVFKDLNLANIFYLSLSLFLSCSISLSLFCSCSISLSFLINPLSFSLSLMVYTTVTRLVFF